MRVAKPLASLVAAAGAPVAFGLVGVGCYVAGFLVANLSGRKGNALKVEFVERQKTDGKAASPKEQSTEGEVKTPTAPELSGNEFYFGHSTVVPQTRRKKMLLKAALSPPVGAEAGAPPASAPLHPLQPLHPEQPEPPACFDLDRCEELLKLARHAYQHPPEGEGYQTQDVEGLPSVTYYDKDVMTSIYSGVLMVKLHGANNLRPARGKGDVSPYAEVFLTSGSFRTKADRKTPNPIWNASAALFVRSNGWDAMTIEVYDNNRRNDILGTAVLGLGIEELRKCGGAEVTFRLPLRGATGESGSVLLSCRFQEFTVCDPDNIPELKPPPRREGNGKDKPVEYSKLEAINGLKPAAFVENKSTDTQVWLHCNLEQRKLVFSFRGTETAKRKDIMTDANLIPGSFKALVDNKAKGNVGVHRGFMNAYDSVRRQLSTLLHAITVSVGGGAPWDILVTGHSLGGALATLASYELASFKKLAGNVRSVCLYTYGCPRVGNKDFAQEFNSTLPDAWRVTNRWDLVPSIPPAGVFFKFTHVGNPVRLRQDGIFWEGTENMKDDIEKDVNWVVSLFSWQGLTQHEGEYYYNMLAAGRKLLQDGQAAQAATVTVAA